MMPAVTRIENAAQRKSTRSMTNSRIRRDRTVIGRCSLTQSLFERDLAVTVSSGKHRPGLAAGVPRAHEFQLAGRQRDVAHLAYQRGTLIQIEVDEALHLGAVQRLHLRIDEHRT